jgi:hypothetical protein
MQLLIIRNRIKMTRNFEKIGLVGGINGDSALD